MWIKEGVRKKRRREGKEKKKSHLFPSSKGFLKTLTRSLDGNALYGCIIIWSALEYPGPQMHLRWDL